MSRAQKSDKEKFPVVLIAGIGMGILKENHGHHAVVEFNDGKHKWTMVVTESEYDIVNEPSIGYEEL